MHEVAAENIGTGKARYTEDVNVALSLIAILQSLDGYK
jgi:hypothetical protein